MAQEIVDTQGSVLSGTGGNFGGQLHTVPSLQVAEEFAARTAAKAGTTETGVVGIALPKHIADMLRSRGLLTRSPIQNPPPGVSAGAQQWVFQTGALKALQDYRFFFRIN
jgi:hypothetical protein